MKVIIAGSRSIHNYSVLLKTMNSARDNGWEITEIVSGGAYGVDQLGERYASEFGIPLKRFPADWNRHGRSAGFIRNEKMAEYADALIAIWDGKGSGTVHMIKQAEKNNLKLMITIHGE